MDTLTFIACLVLCVITTAVNIAIYYVRNEYDGVFRINTSNPEKDVYSLELNDILGDLENKKELRLKIVNECSQEKPLA